MSASSAGMTGADTGQGVPIGTLRFGRVKSPVIPSSAAKKNTLSFLIGPPAVPPNCSRWKSSNLVPSDKSPVSASRR